MRITFSVGGARANALYDELVGGMITAAAGLGHQARRADPPAEVAHALGETDLLVLAGAGAQFRGFRKLLAGSKKHRPKVLLWLIEPLPPPSTIPVACRLLDSPLSKLEPALPARLGWLRQWISAKRSAGFEEALVAAGYPGVEPRFLIRRLEWLRDQAKSGWIDRVVVTTPAKVQALQAAGLAAHFVPIGYCEALGTDRVQARDIDVLFLGGFEGGHARRASTVDMTREGCRAVGLRFEQVSAACYGEERTLLVNRSKILLNLAKYPWDISIERFLIGAGCRAALLSEPLGNTGPLVPGKHYAEAALTEIPLRAAQICGDAIGRQALTSAAWELIQGELSMRESIRRLVGLIDSPAHEPSIPAVPSDV